MDEIRHTKLENTNTTAKNENENEKNSEKPEKIIKKCANKYNRPTSFVLKSEEFNAKLSHYYDEQKNQQQQSHQDQKNHHQPEFLNIWKGNYNNKNQRKTYHSHHQQVDRRSKLRRFNHTHTDNNNKNNNNNENDNVSLSSAIETENHTQNASKNHQLKIRNSQNLDMYNELSNNYDTFSDELAASDSDQEIDENDELQYDYNESSEIPSENDDDYNDNEKIDIEHDKRFKLQGRKSVENVKFGQKMSKKFIGSSRISLPVSNSSSSSSSDSSRSNSIDNDENPYLNAVIREHAQSISHVQFEAEPSISNLKPKIGLRVRNNSRPQAKFDKLRLVSKNESQKSNRRRPSDNISSCNLDLVIQNAVSSFLANKLYKNQIVLSCAFFFFGIGFLNYNKYVLMRYENYPMTSFGLFFQALIMGFFCAYAKKRTDEIRKQKKFKNLQNEGLLSYDSPPDSPVGMTGFYRQNSDPDNMSTDATFLPGITTCTSDVDGPNPSDVRPMVNTTNPQKLIDHSSSSDNEQNFRINIQIEREPQTDTKISTTTTKSKISETNLTRTDFKKLFIVCLLEASYLTMMQLSLKSLNIAIFDTIKRIQPLFTVLFGLIFLDNQKQTFYQFFCLGLMLVGTVISLYDLIFNNNSSSDSISAVRSISFALTGLIIKSLSKTFVEKYGKKSYTLNAYLYKTERIKIFMYPITCVLFEGALLIRFLEHLLLLRPGIIEEKVYDFDFHYKNGTSDIANYSAAATSASYNYAELTTFFIHLICITLFGCCFKVILTQTNMIVGATMMTIISQFKSLLTTLQGILLPLQPVEITKMIAIGLIVSACGGILYAISVVWLRMERKRIKKKRERRTNHKSQNLQASFKNNHKNHHHVHLRNRSVDIMASIHSVDLINDVNNYELDETSTSNQTTIDSNNGQILINQISSKLKNTNKYSIINA